MTAQILSIQQVVDRVEEIRRVANDDPRAHALEDHLWEDVLETIVSGHISLHASIQMCRVALTTKDIEFARWRE